MKYLAAYMLAKLGQRQAVKPDEIVKILESIGIEACIKRATIICEKLDGKDLNELVVEGDNIMNSIGGVASGSLPVSGDAVVADSGKPAASTVATKEAPKEESDESDDDMGLGLFD